MLFQLEAKVANKHSIEAQVAQIHHRYTDAQPGSVY